MGPATSNAADTADTRHLTDISTLLEKRGTCSALGRTRGLATQTDDPLAWYAAAMERLDDAS
jgi:hypothetical protein